MTTEQAIQTEVIAQFTVNQTAFAKALKAVAPFVSEDDARTNLTGVMLEILPPEYKSIRLVATDGHKLIYVELAVEFGTSSASAIRDTNDKIILPVDTLAKFCDAKSLLPLDFDIKRQKNTMLVDMKSGAATVGFTSTLTFPDYRQFVLAQAKEDLSSIRLNAKYLEAASKAIASLAADRYTQNVDIRIGDQYAPVELKKKEGLITFVTDVAVYIMPVRK